ncbi:MAG: hypothetical protein ACYTFG_18580, partial [Planctomycetota bacterium]
EEGAVSDGFDGEWTLARTASEAPEVDPVVWVPGRVPAGMRGRIRIDGLQGPDLIGTWIGGKRGGEEEGSGSEPPGGGR